MRKKIMVYAFLLCLIACPAPGGAYAHEAGVNDGGIQIFSWQQKTLWKTYYYERDIKDNIYFEEWKNGIKYAGILSKVKVVKEGQLYRVQYYGIIYH